MNNSFGVVLLGSDANTYSMARCYHELYHTKIDMIGKEKIAITKYSSIINFIEKPDIYSKNHFVEHLHIYAEQSNKEKIVLIATNDKFVRLIVENKQRLHKKFTFNYPRLDIVNTLLRKDNFYKAYNGELPLPKTFIYSCKDRPVLKDEKFIYPIVLKPGNGIEYYNHHFSGMSKVYKILSYDELVSTIQTIENSGYTDNLIIQEFIPGDDCLLYDAVFYCGIDGKVQLMTFAQIGLQERTNTGVGNCTVLVNGFAEHGYKEDLIYKMKDFLEKIGYQGFAEFDLKYDTRDMSYKILEINPRQARSSYYLAACGHNLVKSLVDDLIHHINVPLVLIREKMVLSFVPISVIRNYVTSEALKSEIRDLISKGKIARPLHYKGDKSILRKIYLFLRDINYMQKYKKLQKF
jgi:D-aspartate ligase